MTWQPISTAPKDGRRRDLQRYAYVAVTKWTDSCTTVVDAKTFERMVAGVERALRPSIAHLLMDAEPLPEPPTE